MKGPETVDVASGIPQGARTQESVAALMMRPGARKGGLSRPQRCSLEGQRTCGSRAGLRIVPAASTPPAKQVAAATSIAVRKPVPSCTGFR